MRIIAMIDVADVIERILQHLAVLDPVPVPVPVQLAGCSSGARIKTNGCITRFARLLCPVGLRGRWMPLQADIV